MHHGVVFHFLNLACAFGVLGMSLFHKMSKKKCGHREPTEKLMFSRIRWINAISPLKTWQKVTVNAKQAGSTLNRYGDKFLKMTSTFFLPTILKKVKNMLNYDVDGKEHFLMPINLEKPTFHEFGMITWEGNPGCGRRTLVEPSCDVPTLLMVDLVLRRLTSHFVHFRFWRLHFDTSFLRLRSVEIMGVWILKISAKIRCFLSLK